MIYVVLGVFIFGLIVVFLAVIINDVLYTRHAVMTAGELRFFKILKTVVPPAQVIFSQVRLASIVTPRGPFKWSNFSPLAIRSVDFVIVDAHTGNTLLVIELDDKSHRLAHRYFRDRFIDRALTSANIPVVHIPYQINYDQNSLKLMLEKQSMNNANKA